MGYTKHLTPEDFTNQKIVLTAKEIKSLQLILSDYLLYTQHTRIDANYSVNHFFAVFPHHSRSLLDREEYEGSPDRCYARCSSDGDLLHHSHGWWQLSHNELKKADYRPKSFYWLCTARLTCSLPTWRVIGLVILCKCSTGINGVWYFLAFLSESIILLRLISWAVFMNSGKIKPLYIRIVALKEAHADMQFQLFQFDTKGMNADIWTKHLAIGNFNHLSDYCIGYATLAAFLDFCSSTM